MEADNFCGFVRHANLLSRFDSFKSNRDSIDYKRIRPVPRNLWARDRDSDPRRLNYSPLVTRREFRGKVLSMKRIVSSSVLAAGLMVSAVSPLQRGPSAPALRAGHLGFDRNEYPGDDSLNVLRRTFEFAGYWLNNPPGASNNSWVGRRRVMQVAGFGFLVIFNGRTDAQIKAAGDATKLGSSDAAEAVTSVRREGFPPRTIIFIDQEEGGRLLPEQRGYLHAWADTVESSGFRVGVYCSGIAFKEASGASVITVEDIRKNAGGRRLTYWVTNDSCPPSLGCAFPRTVPATPSSGVAFAEIWQFAQSPRRADFAGGCSGYREDGNCYSPGVDVSKHLHIDLDVATSSDPSHGRTPD